LLGNPENNQPFSNQAEGFFIFQKYFIEKEGFFKNL